MSGPAPLHRYTYADYLALEESSNVKHEYLAGEIYGMAGGTPEHAALAATVTATLVNQLAGTDCRVYSSDLRVRVMATGLTTYPDITVVCGPIETDPESRHTATNPRMLVEVLSDGTEKYDRGDKLAHYRQVAALAVVVLVATRERRIEVHRRAAGGAWSMAAHGAGEVAAIAEVGCRLAVDAIYERSQI